MMQSDRSSPPASATPTTTAAAAAAATAAARSSVLVVEHPGPFLSCLRIMLTSLDYDVTVATHADDAARLLADARPRLILVSLDLPQSDGTSLTVRLRDISRGAPLILISHKGEEQQVVANLEAGAQDFIARPFEIETLEKRLRNALRRCEAGARTVGSA